MQTIRVIVPRRRDFVPGDAFEVFANDGAGPVDYGRAITPRPISFWPEAEPSAGHLLDGHLLNRHVAAVRVDGHLEGAHLLDEHLWPQRAMVFETEAVYVGRHRHGVRVVDSAGNVRVSPSVEAETVINTSPEPACDFAAVSSEIGSGRMTFEFVASPQVDN